MPPLQKPPTADSAALAVSIGSAVLYFATVCSLPSRWRMVVKMASTALLSAVAVMRGGPLLLVGALALGSIGDAFLAWNDDTSFLCGLASFLLAHVLYVMLFFRTNNNGAAEFQVLFDGWRAMVAGALTVFVSIIVASLMSRIVPELRLPVVLYSLTIFVMTITALTLENNQVIFGAVMFCSSDSILAVDRFLVSPASSCRPWMQHAVWILYYGGQLLIVVGVLSLLAKS